MFEQGKSNAEIERATTQFMEEQQAGGSAAGANV